MFSHKFIIRPDKKNALVLRIVNNRKKAEIACGFHLEAADLDDALSPAPSRKNVRMAALLAMWQGKIASMKLELAVEGLTAMDVKELKARLLLLLFGKEQKAEGGESQGEFVTWYRKFADTHSSETNTRSCYYHTLSRMRAFCPELEFLPFSAITVGWLEDFDRFLAKTCKLNSRNHHMRNIRAVFKYAIRHDLDIRNPFDRMRLKTEKTAKRSLEIEELREVFSMDVLPYAEIYRDMFKLSFMLIGINPIDLYRLNEVSKQGRVDFIRAKTHKPYSIKVEPEAMEIILRYKGTDQLLLLADRWKVSLSFLTAANKALQKLGARHVGSGFSRADVSRWPNLTMYWARHSWATIAADLDIPDAVISMALGHSGENRVTDIYIRRNQRKVDAANRMVLDWVLYGRRGKWTGD